jgi:hypothetical protein
MDVLAEVALVVATVIIAASEECEECDGGCLDTPVDVEAA